MEAQHPNWCQSDTETAMYMDIVKKSMGGMNMLRRVKF